MRIRTMAPALCAAALGLAALLCLSGQGQDGSRNPYVQALKACSGNLVCVKYVLEIGTEDDAMEVSGEVTGSLVDPSGLVMIPGSSLHAGIGEGESQAPKMKASNFVVVFPDDDKEYDAVLAATDTKLNLAFLAPAGLGDRKIECVDFSARAGTPSLGAELVGVDRLGKGFDYAPYFEKYVVSGEVRQPRPMYVLSCSMSILGLPIYDLSGRPVGVITEQTDSGRDLVISAEFLIPADAVNSTIQAAKKKAEESRKKPD